MRIQLVSFLIAPAQPPVASSLLPPGKMLRKSKHQYERLDPYSSAPDAYPLQRGLHGFVASDPALGISPGMDGSARCSASGGAPAVGTGGRQHGGGGDEGEACMICMDREADAVLVECGHGGLCAACAVACWDGLASGRRACPLCRRGFAGVMRIRGHDGDLVRPPVRRFGGGSRLCGGRGMEVWQGMLTKKLGTEGTGRAGG